MKKMSMTIMKINPKNQSSLFNKNLQHNSHSFGKKFYRILNVQKHVKMLKTSASQESQVLHQKKA